MAQGDTKVFNGVLYYEDNGRWVPYSIPTIGAGGGMGRRGPIGPMGPAGPVGSGDVVESGFFSVSADGSSVDVNGSPTDAKVTFSVDSVAGLAVGQTLTNTTSSATGVITAILVGPKRVTVDSLTAGIWLVGDSLTNGSSTPTITGAIQPFWTFLIPTTNQAKLIFFSCTDRNNRLVNSTGIDNAVVSPELSYHTVDGGVQEGFVDGGVSSIFLREDDNNGWSGFVQSIASTSFTIKLFSFPVSGIEFDGRWKAITG